MATVLSIGDIAIVHYNSTSTDAFTFVFLRSIEAGTTVSFTDNGWLAAGGFRAGEQTVTYTAPTMITAGTIITLTGLNLDDAGDQIIAYQGDPATPTILQVVDFADGNNTVAGDATDDNTTALPSGFTLGINAVAVAFDNSLYAGPINGSAGGLFTALNNSTNWLNGDALPAPFFFDARPTIDLDGNNSSGAFGFDYLAFVGSGGSAVPISDVDVDIDDSDDFDLLAAQITIIGASPGDLLAITGSLPFGIVAQAYNPVTGVLRLDGLGSHADYQTAIRQVRFSTAASPGDLKVIQVSVFDGFSWSHDTEALIHVVTSLGGAPPALDLDANNSTGGGADATATYAAGAPAVPVTDIDVRITDDGTTIQSATIDILGWSLHAGDVLSIAGTLPTGITASSYNPFNGEITLSGSASLADYQTALRQVVYSSTLSAPSTADRGIQVIVNDGSFNSNSATMYMHVVIPPPNVAPMLDLDANNSTTTGANYLTGFTEGGPPVTIADTDVSIFDSDSPNLASATITLTNPQADDVLTFEGTPPPGIAVSGSGTAVITLTGSASSGSYQTALQQIKFDNSSIDPSNITRTIEVVVSDGASNSNTATALVQVEAVNNSAPVIDLDPDDSTGTVRTTFRTMFTENGTPIAIADADVSITDLDSTMLVLATITLANQQTGDLLSVATLPLPGGIVASAYDPGTGVLTLSGTATLDNYEAALRQIRYSNDSDNPDTVDRLIEVVVSDGVNTSNVAAAVIGVVPVNDAPAIVLEPSATYVENAAIVTLDPDALVTDLDNVDLSQAVIRISSGGVLGDVLTIGGDTGGSLNGITFIFDVAEHAMVLTGASSVLNYQNLLRTVGFHSTSDTPTNLGESTSRTLTWSVSDGAAVTTATTTLNVVPVNDAPQATVAAAASYTENAAPVVLSPAATVTDVDNPTLVSGEVRIVSTAPDSDLLTVNGLQSGTFSGIDFSYDAVLHNLTFSGPTTVADYQAFLQAVAFSSTSDNPTDFGLNPTRTLSWFIFDGDALSDVQTTVVTITALADAPVNTVPGPQSVDEEATLLIAGVSVADVDSPTLTTSLTVSSGTINVTTGPGVSNNGSASVIITGTLTDINTALAGLSYTGNLNFNGADTLIVTTDDGTAPPDIDTIAITVNPVNDAPVAQDGSASGNEDTPISGTLAASDIDSPILTYRLGTQALHGTAVVSSDGTFTYTPAQDFNGTDSFTFIANDTAVDSNTATVSLSIAAVNDAPVAQDGSASGNEDAPVSGTLIATDIDSESLTFRLGTQAAHGTAVVNSDGTYTYTPNPDFNGTDSFTFIANDSGVDSNTATVSLTIAAVNDPPVAQSGSASGNEDTPITDTLVATDVDSPILTYSLGTPTANGAIVLNLDGSFTYTPNADFNGSDFFTFRANDGTADSGFASFTFIVNPVNDPPVAQDGSASGTEDTPISGTVVATDVDSPILTYSLATSSANGIVVVNPDGSYTYTPNADFNGSDTFGFKANDGTSDSNVGFVILIVNPVPDAPVNTVPSAQNASEDTALAIAGLSVADVDSPTLTTTLTVTNGTLAIVAGAARVTGFLTNSLTISGTIAEVNAALASVNYLGNPNFTGSDTLTVTTDDGTTTPDVDTVAITVAPVADAPEIDLDSNNSSGAPGSGYITAFTENGPPAPLADADIFLTADDDNLVGVTFRLINSHPGDTLVVNGTLPSGITANLVGSELTLSGTGSAATYTAALGQIAFNNPGEAPEPGNRLILVSVDGGTATANAFVIVQVQPVNDPPVAQSGSASGSEDAPVTGALVATDVDDPALSYSLGTQATNGTVVVNADGTYTYTPNANFNGTDSFTFLANDGEADSNTATVNLTITAVNDPPVAQNGSANGNEDAPVSGTLIATDVDSEGLTYRLGTQAAHGIAVVNPDGSYTYTPHHDFNGTDSFTFLANDGAADSNTATVNLAIAAVNDAPHLDLDADDSAVPSTHFATIFAGAPVPISDVDVAIADPDSATLASATIHLLVPSSGDLLSVSGALPAGISASAYDPVTGMLTLSGEASLAGYQTAIHQVEFNTSGASTASRMIEVKVNDGTLDSNAAVSVIDFSAAPEPPEPPATVDTHWMATPDFTPHPAGWSPILVGDFAGDDMIDLIWRSDSTGSLDEWQIVNGGWTRSVDLGGHPVAGLQPAAAGDFDGDGTDDILWFDPANGNTDIWQMGNGEHTASLSLGPHPPGFQVAGTGDFDGDGTTDILFFSAQTGALDIWKIENGQWAGSVDPGPAPAGFSIADTGDVNHDGSDDVIWFNASSGDVQIWQMENGQLAESVDIGPHPPGYTIIGSDDFTGDGTDDILWFNQATGNVDLWKMEDGHWAGSVDIGFHPPGWQPIGIGDTDANGIADVWWRQGTSTHVEIWLLSID